MQIIQELIVHKRQVLKLILLGSINIFLIRCIGKRKDIVNKIQKIKKQQLLTIQQAQNLAKQQQSSIKRKTSIFENNNDNQFLLKVKPDNQYQTLHWRKQLRSNQFWLTQPSLKGVANQAIDIINNALIDCDQKALKRLRKQKMQYSLKWKVKPQNSLQSIEVNGFGRVVDDEVFDVKYKYYPDVKIGFFRKLYENVAFFLQLIFFQRYTSFEKQQKYRLSRNHDRSPVIKGPVIGQIYYLFNFVANRYILIQAKIQDGKITPMLMSSSRQKIIQFYNSQINSFNTKIFISLICSLIVYRSLYKFLKKKFLQLKTKIIRPQFRFNKMKKFCLQDTQKLDQTKLCIICYTNVRNTILLNCRHLILCDECKQIYNHETCPLCKAEIEEEKVLFQTQN